MQMPFLLQEGCLGVETLTEEDTMIRTSVFSRAAIMAGAAFFVFGIGTSDVALAAEKKGAKIITSSSDKVKVRITGQISRTANYIDDGSPGSSRMRYMDSNYSSSRFRILTSSKITSDIKVNGRMEIAVDDARNFQGVAAFGGRSGNDFQTRKTELYFTHKQFGRVWIGAGTTAGDGIMNNGISGVYAALPAGDGLDVGGINFRNADGSNSGATILGTFTDFDFFGRQTRVMYDTPVIAGFMASVSHSDEQIWEASLNYSGTILDTKVKARIGYGDASLSDNRDFAGGSISAVHSSGLGATFNLGATNEDVRDQTNGAEDRFGWQIQGHFGRKFTELGKSTIVGSFWYIENVAQSGDIGKATAVTFQQNVDAAALQLWAKYINFDLNRPGSDFDDINTFSVGARVKF